MRITSRVKGLPILVGGNSYCIYIYYILTSLVMGEGYRRPGM